LRIEYCIILQHYSAQNFYYVVLTTRTVEKFILDVFNLRTWPVCSK